MKSANIEIPSDRIAAFCRRWKITEMALFGSVLSADFRPDSDVDVLVTFAPDAGYGLIELVYAARELERMFGRRVHLIEKAGIRNPFRRREILRTMRVIHAA